LIHVNVTMETAVSEGVHEDQADAEATGAPAAPPPRRAVIRLKVSPQAVARVKADAALREARDRKLERRRMQKRAQRARRKERMQERVRLIRLATSGVDSVDRPIGPVGPVGPVDSDVVISTRLPEDPTPPASSGAGRHPHLLAHQSAEVNTTPPADRLGPKKDAKKKIDRLKKELGIKRR